MPPVDEPKPDQVDVIAVLGWIESSLRDSAQRPDTRQNPTVTRRLTNLEYQNSLRDLLGFELDVIEDLPRHEFGA